MENNNTGYFYKTFYRGRYICTSELRISQLADYGVYKELSGLLQWYGRSRRTEQIEEAVKNVLAAWSVGDTWKYEYVGRLGEISSDG